EQLRLTLQPLRDAVPQTVLDGFERRERRRVVAPRLLQDLLAGHAEHQRAAERVAVEQPPDEAARPAPLGLPATGHFPCRGEGDVLEDRARYQLVDDAEPERLGRPLGLAGEDDI